MNNKNGWMNTPGCTRTGADPDFDRIVDFYKELWWLKKEFKKKLNWKLNQEWFICRTENKDNTDRYSLHLKKGVINKKNVLMVERLLKLVQKKLKVIEFNFNGE